MAHYGDDELARKTPTAGEALMPSRERCIIALAYVWRHAEGREDALLISQALGIDHLLTPALEARSTHAVP